MYRNINKQMLREPAILCTITLGTVCVLFGLSPDHKPKFKVGDCFKPIPSEEWQLNNVCKIKKVGKHKYLVECPDPELPGDLSLGIEPVYKVSEPLFTDIDGVMELTNCIDYIPTVR